MKAEDVVKAYHLLEDLRLAQAAKAAFDKSNSTLEVTGYPQARLMFNSDCRARFREVLATHIGKIWSQLQALGVTDFNEGNHAGS